MDDGPERWETSRNSHITRSLFEPLFCTPRQLLSAPTTSFAAQLRGIHIGIVNYNWQQCSLLALPPLSPSAPLSGLSAKLVLSPRPCLAVRNPAAIRRITCCDMRQLVFRSQLNEKGRSFVTLKCDVYKPVS